LKSFIIKLSLNCNLKDSTIIPADILSDIVISIFNSKLINKESLHDNGIEIGVLSLEMTAYEKFRLNIYNQLNYGDINVIIDDIDSNDTAIFERIKESIRRRGIIGINRISNTQKKKDISRIKHDRKIITLIDGITSNNKLDEVVAREDHDDMLLNAEVVIATNNVDDFVACDDHELNTEETFQGHIINCDNDTLLIDLIDNDNDKDNYTSDPGFVGKAEKKPRKKTQTILKRKRGRSFIDPSLKVNDVPAKNKVDAVDDVSPSIDIDQAAPFDTTVIKKKRGFQKGHKINSKGKITAYDDLET
jgi:hypothetical protein